MHTPLPTITDIHTHDTTRRGNAIVAGSPQEVAQWCNLWPGAQFAAGIHPWDTEQIKNGNIETELEQLRHVATLPQVTVIGETGLDPMRGADLATQEQLLQLHIALSEELHKPLLLHIVRTGSRLLQLRKQQLRELTQPWIWHGFRGKPQQAAQFLATATAESPAYISLGYNFNPATAASLPRHAILAETDNSPFDIATVIRRIAAARSESPDELHRQLAANAMNATRQRPTTARP